MVELSLEQAQHEVAGALEGGSGAFGLEEINAADAEVDDESDGEHYDEEDCM